MTKREIKWSILVKNRSELPAPSGTTVKCQLQHFDGSDWVDKGDPVVVDPYQGYGIVLDEGFRLTTEPVLTREPGAGCGPRIKTARSKPGKPHVEPLFETGVGAAAAGGDVASEAPAAVESADGDPPPDDKVDP